MTYPIMHAASDPAAGWGEGGGGARNMKSMWPPLAAIFFMAHFYRAWGGHGPLGTPLDPLLARDVTYPPL